MEPAMIATTAGYKSPDPGAHHHTRATGVSVEFTGVGQGHVGHGHGELGEPVDLASLLGGEPLLGVELGYPARTFGG